MEEWDGDPPDCEAPTPPLLPDPGKTGWRGNCLSALGGNNWDPSASQLDAPAWGQSIPEGSPEAKLAIQRHREAQEASKAQVPSYQMPLLNTTRKDWQLQSRSRHLCEPSAVHPLVATSDPKARNEKPFEVNRKCAKIGGPLFNFWWIDLSASLEQLTQSQAHTRTKTKPKTTNEVPHRDPAPGPPSESGGSNLLSVAAQAAEQLTGALAPRAPRKGNPTLKGNRTETQRGQSRRLPSNFSRKPSGFGKWKPGREPIHLGLHFASQPSGSSAMP